MVSLTSQLGLTYHRSWGSIKTKGFSLSVLMVYATPKRVLTCCMSILYCLLDVYHVLRTPTYSRSSLSPSLYKSDSYTKSVLLSWYSCPLGRHFFLWHGGGSRGVLRDLRFAQSRLVLVLLSVCRFCSAIEGGMRYFG